MLNNMTEAHHGRHATTAVSHPSIAIDINAATKVLHTELNRLIIERLPLALPPYTHLPTRYALGVKRFAAIFLAIEREIDLLAQKREESTTKHSEDVNAWLENLLPDGLQRTQRFSDDVLHLEKRTRTVLNIDQRVAKEQARLHAVVATRPHVLVAYVWIMYMAIFSGGRHIRKHLASVDESFWTGRTNDIPEKQSLSMPGFTFMSFDDDSDGEDLKTEFKRRLAFADDLLTLEERAEVVEEGRVLFQHCITTIKEIDWEVICFESVSTLRLVLVFLTLVLLCSFWMARRHGFWLI